MEGLALGVTGRMRMWAFDRGRSGFPSKSCRMRSRRCSLLSHSPMEEGRYSPASLCCLPYRPPASPRSPLYALPRRLIPHSRELKSLHPRNRALALQICACILNNSALVWLRRTSAPSSAWCRRKSRSTSGPHPPPRLTTPASALPLPRSPRLAPVRSPPPHALLLRLFKLPGRAASGDGRRGVRAALEVSCTPRE